MPFAAYAAGQTSIEFATASTLFASIPTGGGGVEVDYLPVNLNSTVPTPFGGVFSLQQPMVTSVSTDEVDPGQTFTIQGSGLYPSLVTGVLIGGQALPEANFQVVSDTETTVVAPDTASDDLPVVVQTTQGVSNDNVTMG